MKSRYCCFLLLSIFLTACGPKQLRQEKWQVSADTPDPAKPPNEFYTIGAGDVLEVVVWKDSTLSGPVTVRPDGYITLPLINEVQVVGLTTTQLRETLEKKYSEFVTSPSVTVRVTTIASSEILLVGEVASPGVYPLVGNMIVPVELLQRAIDPMIKKKFGRIVNITSGSVKMPLVGLDLSSGARAGLTAFLAGIARSVAQHNVTINFMLPGPFDTDRLRSNHEITAKKQGITVEEALKQRMATIPARRLGQADEFGATCAFLCSTHAGFITGQNILLDGGIFPGAF